MIGGWRRGAGAAGRGARWWRVGGVFDGAEAGEEGRDPADLGGVGLGVEEFEEGVECALVGVQDGLVVRLDRGALHVGPLSWLVWPRGSIPRAFGLCKVKRRYLFGIHLWRGGEWV